MLEDATRNRISIPEYYKRFIDNRVDLSEEPSQCCPVHSEKTPSFRYSAERQKWRCFGSCKAGGDVIEMHKWYKKLISREEAIASLAQMLGIKATEISFERKQPKPDLQEAEMLTKLNLANKMCKTPEDYAELDYIMSQYKGNRELIQDLGMFLNRKGGNVFNAD